MALPRMLQFMHSVDDTTIVKNDQVVTAKDIAISVDINKLASVRGFFYDEYIPWYQGTPNDTYLISDFNEFTRPGKYHIRWREGTDAVDAEGRETPVTANNPGFAGSNSSWFDGTVEIVRIHSASSVSYWSRIVQYVTTYVTAASTINNAEGQRCRTAMRMYINNSDSQWTAWRILPFEDQFGPGQIGEAKEIVDPDFNTIKEVGIYRTLGEPTNGPSNIGIDGARIGVLVVSGRTGNNNRLFQTMTSENTICWRTSIDNGDTWTEWRQILTNNIIGDGIRLTNGKISIPEMQGATSKANGVSGLVPPPLIADLGKSLGANGEWEYPADIAVDNDQSDLASLRGQLGNPTYTRLNSTSDFNTYTQSGTYGLYWDYEAARPINAPTYGSNGILCVFAPNQQRIKQLWYRLGTYDVNDYQIFIRTYSGDNAGWSNWHFVITNKQIGDGLKLEIDKISVPEYEGATTSSAGTAGLVPPATTKQTDFVLCGDGEWKDISKIAAHAAGPSNKTITITLTGTSTTYTAPETGWISYRAVSTTANSWISLTIETTTLYAVDRPISDNSNIALNLPISKGQKATINCASNVTFTSREAHFIYTNGSVPA